MACICIWRVFFDKIKYYNKKIYFFRSQKQIRTSGAFYSHRKKRATV